MARTRTLGMGLTLLFLAAGCGSHPSPTTDVWLRFEQASSASRFVMAVTVTGRAGVSAEGPLVNGSRQSGQLSRTNLTSAEREELERLLTSGLLEAYEVDAQASGINTSGADQLVFAVFLDKDPEQSPAPRTVALGFPADEAMSDVTRTLLEKLNVTLTTSWSRGTKEGPNPGLVEPEPIPQP